MVRVGNFGAEVREILGQRRRLVALSNALARLSVSLFVLQIFASKSQGRRKTEEMQKFLSPCFCPEG